MQLQAGRGVQGCARPARLLAAPRPPAPSAAPQQLGQTPRYNQHAQRLATCSARRGSDERSGTRAVEATVVNSQAEEQQQARSSLGAWWDAIPSRYKLLLATSFSFVICNMDKVNMSVAIIPMAMDFGWSPSVSGTIQASFFYGYMLTQLPGGYLCSALGGRKVLPAGVALWSGMTCAVPLLASTLPGLCLARVGVGLGEAVAPSAATDMIARVVPPSERSRAVSFVFGGLHVGSILGLLAAPALIHEFGWQSVFLVFGAAGLLWVAGFEALVANVRERDPAFDIQLATPPSSPPTSSSSHSLAQTSSGNPAQQLPRATAAGSQATAAAAPAGKAVPQQQGDGHAAGEHDAGGDHHGVLIDTSMSIPYRAFLRSKPVQALCFTHFAHNWFHYTMLAWLPYYFVQTLSVDLMHAAQTALFPPMAGIVASATAGPLADYLLGRGLPTPRVRKLVQGASFLLPCAFLLAASQWEGEQGGSVACITAALGMSSLSLAGLYCTHQDMSPRYASALLGLTNTVGAIPGIIGVATVGYLYDYTHSWHDALFLPSALCMLAGAYVYTFHASNHPINFDELNNEPFWFERFLPKLPSLPWQRKKQQ